jgi:hypothetical protein
MGIGRFHMSKFPFTPFIRAVSFTPKITERICSSHAFNKAIKKMMDRTESNCPSGPSQLKQGRDGWEK